MDDMERFRVAAAARATGRLSPPEAIAATREMTGARVRTAVLVEGESDRAALEALALRHRRNLNAERVCVIPMGGATNIARFLAVLGPRGSEVRLAGLCDAAEEVHFMRGLERAGLGAHLNRAQMEPIGFYVCVADLEDELIRCLGAQFVEHVIDTQGELSTFRTFQRQPAQRGRPVDQQLRRFLGSISGRKAHYARSIVNRLEPSDAPLPLNRLLASI